MHSNRRFWRAYLAASVLAFLTIVTNISIVEKAAIGAPKALNTLPNKAGADFFEKKIRPILVRHCYECHSGDPAKAKGKLALDSQAGLRKGGQSGAVVVAGHAEDSLLIEALRHEGLEMPPSQKLPDEVIEDFVKWVEMGVPDPRVGKAANPRNKIDLKEARKHWAFQRPRMSPAPKVDGDTWPLSDIDRFIHARLNQEGLQPVDVADRTTLIRRVTFDLIGLPPTLAEIDAFVADTSGNAFASVVDRLLASPHFGERWGRHWLDPVRYAESTGKERNIPYRYAWRYRDYVIDAFNADKPYDRFIVEQLAGDLLHTRNGAGGDHLLIATGFLAVGPKGVNTKNREQFRMDVIDDQIDVTGSDKNLLPLVPTGKPVVISTAKTKEAKTRQDEIARLESQVETLKKANKPGGKKAGKSKKAMANRRPQKVDPKQLREQIKKLEDRFEVLEGAPTPPGELAMGVRDAGTPANSNVLVRGEVKENGPEVPRGVLTVLKTAQTSPITPSHSGRLELAHWIASKDNPLTARVMVNRVWMHLFGQGLVESVDNFGALGSDPTHPELLDTLSVQFMNERWSVKRLIRSIVLSRVYQLSSEHHAGNYAQDGENKFLWRMPRRRLDAEEIRDAMLACSGRLELKRPEGSPVLQMGSDQIKGNDPALREPSNVRSLYLPIIRNRSSDMLGVFDMADPNLIVGKRDVTTVATQALYLLNNPFVLQQSEQMAKRVLAEKGLSNSVRIDLAYRLALGRYPTEFVRREFGNPGGLWHRRKGNGKFRPAMSTGPPLCGSRCAVY